MKQLLRFFVLLVFASPSFSQDDPKATLIDEFGAVTCEDLLARADSFAGAMHKNPNTIGVVIVNSLESGRDRSKYYQRLIESNFQRNGYAIERVLLYRRKTNSSAGGSFWLLLPDEKLPFSDVEPWPDPPPRDLSKPFIYGYEDENGVRPTFVPRLYADLISLNPGSKAHVVVRGGEENSLSSRDFADQWIKTLTEKFGIPRRRIRLYYGKSDNITFAEFWFVPPRKK